MVPPNGQARISIRLWKIPVIAWAKSVKGLGDATERAGERMGESLEGAGERMENMNEPAGTTGERIGD
jgi:hypothetical protein